jgi:hypothetical protein
MISIYIKLCNKQDDCFSEKVIIAKGTKDHQINTYKPFYLMKSSLFYSNIIIFYLFCNANNILKVYISLKDILQFT